MTKIIVDSTCDLPQGYAEKHGIAVLPLHVLINGKEYRDGVDLTVDQVYAYMRQDILPKTSQVAISDTYETFQQMLQQDEDLLYLSFSAKMSGTYALVDRVMKELAPTYPQRKMIALDAKGGSFATGLIAMQASELAEQGAVIETVAERCRFLIDHVEHVFVISDLKWMVWGGRISRTMGYTADLLNIKPVLDVQDGEMEVIRKVHGTRNSLRCVADLVAERAVKCPQQMIGITHADDPQKAEEMRQLLQERLPQCTFAITEIGAVLGVHIGIGGVGVFFFNQMQ
ncbi:MAG: DegV family protein [Oscillospiraceae bacterium]|nr:DegV family protein [Oscillospiraceae bacterium]